MALIPDEKRDAVLADIRAGQKARNQIARDHGVSAASVTGIAKRAGITDAFDRSMTEKATRVKVIDAKAARVQLAIDLLADAQRFRKRAWEPYQVVVSTPQRTEIVTVELPPLQEARAAYNAVGICVDKSLRLEQHDADTGGMSAVDDWLRGMLGETG